MGNPSDKQKPRVLCAGILVADIFLPPLPDLPGEGQLLATEDFLLDAGGCAANTATCLCRLDTRAAVAGTVGQDLFGQFITQNLQDKGLDVSHVIRSPHHGTSKTVILPVLGQDRRYVHTFGANADFEVKDIRRDLVSKVEVFYLGGYLALPSVRPEELADLLRFAQQCGTTTVLDVVVAADKGQTSLRGLEIVLSHVDFFTPNDEEARLLTGVAEPLEQARRFLKAGCRNVVITQGKRGALLMNASGVVEAPAYPVDVVDGSGAGDAFSAGLIYGILQGWDTVAWLKFASAIGASACTRLGTTAGVFSRQQADQFMQAHPMALRVSPST